MSSLVPIFKGKGDPLYPNFYRRIKLLEHAFKLCKKVLDGVCVWWWILIKCNMDLCQGERLLRRKSKKFRAKSKTFFTIVDLEKAFDLVPREAVFL